MPIPKYGVPQHAVWDMDGRQWIETVIDQNDHFKRCLEKGWVKLIPQEKVNELIKTTLEA